MAYFNKYYFEFEDSDYLDPATWRVDIMDSEGATPTEPFLLQPSGVPLITERVDTDENKDPRIIGRQITFNYEYRGTSFPNDPLPEEFFESSERRFRVEVRRNGVLDGVYYIRPDFCERPHIAPPVTITLKAVDGLSYAKAVPFNIYDDDQKIYYTKISWYEAIITRSLNLVIDPNTPINVINSLYPTNIESGVKLLFGCYVHTDIFYDFVKGAASVYDVLLAFAKAMYARIFIERNEIWFIRTQDLTGVSFTAERYTGPAAVSEIAVDDMVRWVAPSPSADAVPVNVDGLIRPTPGMKRVDFDFKYKAINVLTNFDWKSFSSGSFAGWTLFNPVMVISRSGSGSAEDPYKLYIKEDQPSSPSVMYLYQDVDNIIGPGDILQLSLRFRYTNVKVFKMLIRVGTIGGGSDDILTLNAAGGWTYDFGSDPAYLTVNRSGKKREATIDIKSEPIPASTNGGAFPANATVRIQIFAPEEVLTFEGPAEPAIEVYPIKAAVVEISSQGRNVSALSSALVSQKRDTDQASFIDTGDDGLSNTIFTGSPLVPVNGWNNSKPGTPDNDIEMFMSRSFIDQAPRAVQTWSGTLHSNQLPFYSLLEFQYLPGKRFLQLSNKYNNRDCEHSVVIAEVFEEGNATVTFDEYDIEDKEDEN